MAGRGRALIELVGAPLALIVAWALADSSLRLANRILAGSSSATVAVGAIVVAHTQLLAIFEGLGALGGFRAPWVFAATVCVALVLRRALPLPSLSLRGWLSALDRPTRALVAAAALLLVVKALRGMVSPTLAMDGTVYHVPRVVLWIRSGGFARLGAPDALEITDFHPPAGDLPWLYGILFAHNESLVGWASIGVLGEAFLAAYAAGRLLSVPRPTATAAALAIVCTPAVMVYAGSAYVDNAVLAFALCALTLLIDATRRPTFGRAALMSCALTLAACTKVSAAVLFPLVAGALLLAVRFRLALVAGVVSGLCLIAPHVLRSYRLRGSPIYPVGLTLFGKQLFAPNETFELITTAKLFPPQPDDPWTFASVLLRPWFGPLDTTGFGPAFVALFVLGLLGAVATLRTERRWLALLLLAISAVFLGSVWSPSALAFRTEYSVHTARYLTTAVAALTLLAATSPAPWTKRALLLAAAVSFVCALPRGLGMVDARAIGPVLGALVAVAALLWIVRRARRAVSIGAVLVVHLVALGMRASHRDEYLLALANRQIYDIHPIGRVPRGAARVWLTLDRQPPSRVAINAGWNGDGMQLSLSPLLGARLQHTAVWVTPTADGSVIDYRRRAELSARSSYEAWLKRLLDERVDVVACLHPPGLERWWIERHPQQFELLAASDDGTYAAFRVRR